MISTISVLKTLSKRNIYLKYIHNIKKDFFTFEQKLILTNYGKLFNSNKELETINFDELYAAMAHGDLHTRPNLELDEYKVLIEQISNTKACMPDIIVRFCAQAALKEKLFELAGRPKVTKYFIDELETALFEYKSDLNIEEEGHLTTFNLRAALEDTDKGKGLAWSIPELTQLLGKLLPGDFIVFGAMPNVGKTAFGVNMAVDIAKQLDTGKVLYYAGEGSLDRLRVFISHVAIGKDDKWQRANPDEAVEMYTKAMGGDMNKIILARGRGVDLKQVQQDIINLDAKFVVFDQLDHMKYGSAHFATADTDSTKILYEAARELCNDYCPILTLSQLAAGECVKQFIPKGEIKPIKVYVQNIDYTCFRGNKTDKAAAGEIVITMNLIKENSHERNLFIAKTKDNSECDRVGFTVLFNQQTKRFEKRV